MANPPPRPGNSVFETKLVFPILIPLLLLKSSSLKLSHVVVVNVREDVALHTGKVLLHVDVGQHPSPAVHHQPSRLWVVGASVLHTSEAATTLTQFVEFSR